MRTGPGAQQGTDSPAGAGKGRELIIPGAVFMLTKVPRSELVPEEEWNVIDALLDSRISVIGEDGKFLSGPMTGLDHLISRTDKKHRTVQIKVTLLGEPREYWIRAQWAEDADREALPNQNKSEETKMQKEKPIYTEEQNAQMLNRAAEIGVKAAAAELGVTWQYIAQLKRRSAAKPKAAKKATASAKRGRKKANAPESSDELDALKAENAKLKAENIKLEKQLAKLKKSFVKLLD